MADPVSFVLGDDGRFPNNRLPVLFYESVLVPEQASEVLQRNGWSGLWVNGIYDFHHYHSTAHEVLFVMAGQAEVRLGGPEGRALQLTPGTGVVLPAGVAHQCLSCSAEFSVMGAYPAGQSFDMMYGEPDERPAADHRIAAVPLPTSDPFEGDQGPLMRLWSPQQ